MTVLALHANCIISTDETFIFTFESVKRLFTVYIIT
jgi:hypothetical protein